MIMENRDIDEKYLKYYSNDGAISWQCFHLYLILICYI